MKDLFKQHRKILRPGYSIDTRSHHGKNIKNISRRIVRKRLKRLVRKDEELILI